MLEAKESVKKSCMRVQDRYDELPVRVTALIGQRSGYGGVLDSGLQLVRCANLLLWV